ncbi:MAG: Pilus assembly protein ATPase [Pseudomonadota bacterium]
MALKLMLAGMSEADARSLRQAVADIAHDAGYLRDWTQLEAACKQARPDVVAIDIDQRPGQVIALVKRARAMAPGIAFLAVSAEAPGAALVRELTEAGMSDLVLLSEGPGDLRRAVRAASTRERAPTLDGEVIAMLGAKGGVGTTLVAANLAGELAARQPDRKVILVDLHVFLGDVATMLDVAPRPSVLWFLQRGAVADPRNWSEAPPIHAAGFRVLGLDGDVATVDPVSAEQVVFLCAKLRDRYHTVILDLGSDINEVTLAACSVAQQRVMVLTDEHAARTGAIRRRDAMRALDLGPAPTRVILNRAQDWGPAAQERVEKAVGMPVLGGVTNAWQDMQLAMERGQVLRQCAPKSAAARDLGRIADTLGGVAADDDRQKRNFFNFFR